jgi:endonuclease/exonuclease/phosphatase family metal-dependent hydrolase
MRIVSYNILDGGEGRADPLAEVILAQRPDVVALVEADDPAVLERIASRLKMDYIHARGGLHGAALLSGWSIRETIDHTLLAGSATPVALQPKESDTPQSLLEATIVSPQNVEWTIGVLHLHHGAYDRDEQQRERQIAHVLDVFKCCRDARRPHLLLGDFNANAPYQQIDPDKCKPSTRDAWRANGGKLPRRVIQTILDAGYVDTLYAVDPDQARAAVGSFTTRFPGQRVDYIFAFTPADPRIEAAWVERDRLAKYASDHFPVGAEVT